MSAVINEAAANAVPARDTATVLTCRKNLQLAKRIHPDGKVDHYDKARTYTMEDHSLPRGLDSIERLLRMIMLDQRRCVVRGAINREAYGDEKMILNVRRTKKDKGDDLATLIETERYWLAIDVDEAPLPEGAAIKDLRACVRDALSQLPPEFHSADYIVQASGRHGLTPGIRVRLWFWLSRPLGEKALKGWFADVDFVDRSIFNCAQVIYTATPEFAGGRQDHLPERLVHVRQGQPVVQVPEVLPEIRPDAEPGERGYVPKFTPTADADAEKALHEAAEWVRAQKPGNRHGAVLEVTASLARRFILHGRLPRDQVLTEIALALVDAGRGKDEAIDEVGRALGGILESLQREVDEFLKYPLGDDSEDLATQAENEDCTAENQGYQPKLDALEELNLKHMVVNEGGKALVYTPRRDPSTNRRYYDRSSFDDFKKLYLNRTVAIADRDGNITYKKLAPMWLGSRKRREYLNGVVFDPSGKQASGVLNLWEGFAVASKPGDWSLMRSHIRDVICGGNQEHFAYLMGWMARMVQHPAQQGEVAVVLKGGEGTGKGTLARALLHIFGQHGLAISQAKHLVGNFNSHLRDCSFLFSDEAFFAGDKQHVGVLKSIITEPHLTIEGKFQNAVQTPNFLHVMMASNEDWVVPAAIDSRRFFVVQVSDQRKDDHAYFDAIWRQMKAGGYEAMLHDLQTHDLTTFDVRRVPVTAALQEQRERSLQGPTAWWLDVLQRGSLGLPGHSDWAEEVRTEALYDSYKEFAKQRQERHPLPRNLFGKLMNRMGAKPCRLTLGRGERSPGYRLGALSKARDAFVLATGLTSIEWPSEDDNVPREPSPHQTFAAISGR